MRLGNYKEKILNQCPLTVAQLRSYLIDCSLMIYNYCSGFGYCLTAAVSAAVVADYIVDFGSAVD
jgi:hypothetical protein